VRIKLIDADGIVIGDRTIYFLTGDVDGDGEVTNEDSTGSAGVAPYVGQLAHPDSPGSVRADVDADGIVDSNDNGDVINVVGRSVSTIGTILM
jgi:hypothetical protein